MSAGVRRRPAGAMRADDPCSLRAEKHRPEGTDGTFASGDTFLHEFVCFMQDRFPKAAALPLAPPHIISGVGYELPIFGHHRT